MAVAPPRVVLIGPSGSGKSELATRLARALDYAALDTDALLVARCGMPIGAFFERFGESAFRALETEILADACRRERVVIATGGGAVLDPDNWRVMRPHSAVLALTATPATLAARVRAHAEGAGDTAVRPLLAGDAEARLRAQLAVRGPLYAQADAQLDTERRSPEAVAEAALAALADVVARGVPVASVGGSADRSDIYVRRGGAEAVPALLRQRWPRAAHVWVVADDIVARAWLAPLQGRLEAAGLRVSALCMPAGEGSKSFAQVERLCDAMTMAGATRRDVVLALGGGVAGDLGGFIAAIALRGLPFMQLPTSLLAMVDASVGGKTGVNTRGGKNLAGAFYQPGVVAIDPTFLETLPAAEYRSGMAEVIKHALIQPATPLGGHTLLALLDGASSLAPLPTEDIERALALNVAIKASVVQADERESGLRMILNFGHTAGHAIEADGYRYRHGEAVALGMLVAMGIAVRLERASDAQLEQLRRLLERAELPTSLAGSADNVLERLGRDKKNVDGALHWILPDGQGGVGPVTGVPLEVVRDALCAIGAT